MSPETIEALTTIRDYAASTVMVAEAELQNPETSEERVLVLTGMGIAYNDIAETLTRILEND